MKQSKTPLGIYVHIPFCRSKCLYCDFYSLPQAEDRIKRYVKALCANISQIAQYTGGYQVDTVYFGGGTPTLLPERYLTDILERIAQRFHMGRDAEITIEANPESAQNWRALRRLRRGGFNRLSLGVQAADDALLRAVGRIHTFADVERSVEALRRAGFRNFSADLIYGLPGQSQAAWMDSLERTLALGPEHLSCYGLKVEEGTPLHRRQKELSLPDDDTQADMYLSAVQMLTSGGYEHYEISNFARPGFESRHNSAYWQLRPYLGFGPSAASAFGGVRLLFPRDLDAFLAAEDPWALIQAEGPAGGLEEYVMLSLRLEEGLDLDQVTKLGGDPAGMAKRAAPLEKAGYLRRRENRIALTEEGWLVSNGVILALLGE